MNPPRRKQRGITERGFAPITAGGIHPRGKPRGIEPSRLNTVRNYNRYGHPPFGQMVTTCINRSTYERWGHNSTDYWAHCMRTDDKRLFKVYFEKGMKHTRSGALPNTSYHARWFNPRSGEWSDADGIVDLRPSPINTSDLGLSLSVIEPELFSPELGQLLNN
jgi:hypothetical protein